MGTVTAIVPGPAPDDFETAYVALWSAITDPVQRSMRQWLADCHWGDMDSADFADTEIVSDESVSRVVDKTYQGAFRDGVEGFHADWFAEQPAEAEIPAEYAALYPDIYDAPTDDESDGL